MTKTKTKIVQAVAIFAIAFLIAFLVAACGAPVLAPPDAPLPACPTTCTGFCRADGQCTCDGEACQREVESFRDAGVDGVDAL